MDRFVKPHIIAAMGDIALAIGGLFKQYLPFVMKLLIHASTTKFEEEDLVRTHMYLATLVCFLQRILLYLG